MRVVSGRYEKGMKVSHSRSKRQLSLSQAQNLFATERESVLEVISARPTHTHTHARTHMHPHLHIASPSEVEGRREKEGGLRASVPPFWRSR